MKRNNIQQYIQSFNLPLIRIMLVLSVFGIMSSCEIEDDIPPPSAYVAPEPVEGCVQIEGVPVLTEGIDFECIYPEIGTFGETDAAAITVEPVENPFKEGINTSDNVIMVTQEAGVLGYAGLFFDVASKIDFSEEQSIKIKVYSPAAGQTVLLKLEDSSDATLNTETSTTTTVANEWEELSFTFAAGDSDKYERMVLFFNFNGDKDVASVHYFDDIVLGEAGPAEDPMKLPVTFDDPLVNYNVAPFGAEGTAFEIVTNPNLSGSNDTESLVGAITKTGAAFEGLTFNLSEALDLSGDNKTLSVKVYSEVAYTVLLKLETGVNDERSNEVRADHGGTGWETLTFDFATDATTSYLSESDPGGDAIVPSGQYDEISLFLDFNGSAAGTFYVDDLVYMGDDGGSSAAPKLPVDFENGDINYEWFGFGAADFGPIPAGIIDNPDPSGINTSSKVLEVVKVDGAQVWAGASMDLEGAIDFSGSTTLRIKVWSPRAGTPILFKTEVSTSTPDENGNPTVFVEVEQSTTVANAWEELTFDLTTFDAFDPANAYDRLIVFPDYNNPGLGESFYFDDFILGDGSNGGGTATAPTEAAPTPTVASDDVISLFSDAYTDVAVDTWRTDWSVADYTETTVNGDNVKLYSNLNYVGIETIANQVDASSMTHFHVDYWTGNASVFRVKLVDFGPDGGFQGGDDTEHEIEFTVTPNTWVSLDIPLSDFTGLTNTENIAQYIFSAATAGEANVYIDNVYFYKEGSAATEPQSAPPAPMDAAGNVQSIFSDSYTDPAGVNYYPDWSQSTTFEMLDFGGNQVIKYGNANYQGIDFGEALDLTSYTTLKIDVWSGDYTSIPIFLISVGSGEKPVSLNVTPNQWNTIEIPLADFTSQGLDISDIHQIKFDVQPDTGGSFYIDNLYFSSETGGGDTNGGTDTSNLTQIDLPVNFESSTVDYTLTDFGDNMSSIVVDPTDAGNTVAKVIKLSSAETWAGTTIGTNSGFATNIPITLTNSKMTVRVWSPEAGTPIRLKLEDANDPTHTVETEVNTTVAGDWETLEFDFTNQATGTESLSVGLNNGWVYNKASIFFNFGTDGATAGEKTYYFDDVLFID